MTHQFSAHFEIEKAIELGWVCKLGANVQYSRTLMGPLSKTDCRKEEWRKGNGGKGRGMGRRTEKRASERVRVQKVKRKEGRKGEQAARSKAEEVWPSKHTYIVDRRGNEFPRRRVKGIIWQHESTPSPSLSPSPRENKFGFSPYPRSSFVCA